MQYPSDLHRVDGEKQLLVDEAFFFQNIGNRQLQLRAGEGNRAMARLQSIADAGEHISNRITKHT